MAFRDPKVIEKGVLILAAAKTPKELAIKANAQITTHWNGDDFNASCSCKKPQVYTSIFLQPILMNCGSFYWAGIPSVYDGNFTNLEVSELMARSAAVYCGMPLIQCSTKDIKSAQRLMELDWEMAAVARSKAQPGCVYYMHRVIKDEEFIQKGYYVRDDFPIPS